MIMRKKSGFTIVEQAIMLVPDFENVVRKLEQQVTLRGQSKSTLNNYIRRIALFVVHFDNLPEQIDPDEINEFLVALARDFRSPSRSSFKHMVYGLRYYFRLLGMNKKAIALPSLKKEAKLPIILNQQELKEPDSRYSVRGLSWVIIENLKKTSITKDVNLHSLRHAYATHLLEQGLNIVTIKELLGHADITTTMIYLHVAQCPLLKPHSPLDRLYHYPKHENTL
jgi:site-specific recombinase XerD